MVQKVKQSKLPSFYFSFVVLWLRYSGIELLEKQESIPYRIFSAFFVLYVIIFTMLELVELNFHTDFDEIAVVVWYIIMHILTISKAVLIYKGRKEFGDIMKKFHEGFYKPNKQVEDEFEEQCVIRYIDQSRSQIISYGFAIALAVTAGFISSLKTRLTETPENWILPFVSMSFVDITRSPVFAIMYLYQTLACYIFVMYIFLADYTVISIIAQTIAQLSILGHRVRTRRLRTLKNIAVETKVSLNKLLRSNIKHHIDLLETVDKVEHLTSYIILSVFVADLMLLCSVMYNLSSLSIASIEFIRHLGYIGMVGVQLYLYCWWGNEMTLTNEALTMNIFEAYHPDVLIPYTKSLNLMLHVAQRPIFFTAGKFAPLSLETFKAILKGSFSYFTVLRQANSK